MKEFVFALLGFGAVLFFWALIGHGMWVIASYLFRSAFGKRCPNCSFRHLSEKCPNCFRTSRNSQISPPKVEDDLAAAQRLIGLARFQNWLPKEQTTELEKLVRRLETRVHEGREQVVASRSIDSPQTAEPLPQITETFPILPIDLQTPEASAYGSRENAIVSVEPHPLDIDEVSPVVERPQPAFQQRLKAGIFKSFMERSNIRWVELISAALIVVCSVGLVISLWSTLSSTSRFFPSLVFLLATFAVHGAGQYTLRQWKLRTTSRGILHIGLMLIPLAVLVGILLSRRQEALPSLDLFTILVLAIGSVAYSGLAVTASRALFARRWMVVAVATIISSATLVVVYYLGQRQALLHASSILALAPLTIVGFWSAMVVIKMSINSRKLMLRRFRIISGVVTQTIFASLVVFAFWFIQSRTNGGLSAWWWVATGSLAAAWATWGWSASLRPFAIQRLDTEAGNDVKSRPDHRAESSWFAIVAWSLATIFSSFLVAALWQAGGSRYSMIALLLVCASWWLGSGWACNLMLSIAAGGIALLTAIALAFEVPLVESQQLRVTDWISFHRVSLMSSLAFLHAIIALAGFRWSANSLTVNAKHRRMDQPRASMKTIAQGMILSSAIIIVVSCGLTILASLLPIGETPYGGNWASLMLIAYGLLGISGGIVAGKLVEQNKFTTVIMPVGLSILLLGTVRLCHSSPMLDSVLGVLRPDRAWSIGTAILGLFGSALAAGLVASQVRQRQTSNIQILSGFALLVCIPSGFAIWSRPDALELASITGWFLPMTLLGLFYANRQSWFREFGLIALVLWIVSITIYTGIAKTWWSPLGMAASTAVIVSVVSLTIAVFETTLLAIFRRAIISASDESNWIVAHPRWAASTILSTSWIVFLLSLVAAAYPHVAECLGWNVSFEANHFIAMVLSNTGFAMALIATWVLTGATILIGRWHRNAFLFDMTGCVPVAIAFILMAWFAPPYSMSIALWWLGGILIASELLQFIGPVWQDLSASAWQQMGSQKKLLARNDRWLLIARAAAVCLLLVGTGLFVASAVEGRIPTFLPANASDWRSNVESLFIGMGPLLLVALLRWGLSLFNNERSEMTQTTAISTAIIGGTLSALALSGGVAWPTTLIVWLQSTAIVAACLAWCTIGFTTCRNFLGIRRAAGRGANFRTLFASSIKGARFRQSVRSSWTITLFSLTGVVALCLGAAFVVVLFPVAQLVGIGRLGGPLVMVTAMIAWSLFWVLSIERGSTKFGLMGVTLGFVSPIGAAAYANWLQADVARSFPAAADFEPFRMLIALWLFALAIGLGVRIVATANGKMLSTLGELAWIVLASIVGFLAMVSIVRDPNPNWPWIELSFLALLSVLSGVVSNQKWRGHVAAFSAAAGISALLRTAAPTESFVILWNILWGAVWVALVAILVKCAFRFRIGYQTAPTWMMPVEKSVSLVVPVVSAGLSLIWAIDRGAIIQTWTNFHWAVIALSIAGVVLATWRLWEPAQGKRGLAFYLSVVSLLLVLSAGICLRYEIPRLQSELVWMLSGLGAMAIIAGMLRELIREASILGPSLRLSSIAEPAKIRHAMTWMPVLHTVTSFLLLIPSILLVLAFESRSMRIAATTLPFIGALSILPISIDRQRSTFRYCGLALMSISFVLLWWADLPSSLSVTDHIESWAFVHRAFVALIVLGVGYPILGNTLRNKPLWTIPLVNVGWITLALGAVSGVAMMAGQFLHVWDTMAASASIGTKFMTIAGWILISGRLLQFAAKPMQFEKEVGIGLRKTAVYLAELGIAILCGACYFHFPELFHGVLEKWWPLVVFAIAVLSAGIGEWLRRIEQSIIADPIQQSSLLLPIIPLTGVWWLPVSDTPWHWTDWERYALLLLIASCLYGLHSWMRDSVRLRAVAALCGLLSFWSLLHSQANLRFFEHPQFWFLPPSIAVLVFVEVNRDRLNKSVVVAVRYMAILIAYLSSTSEIFLKAFEGQLWQPLLLLILALLGVAAGIVLRVQAFLFSGVVFTAVALLGMVWHAQQAIGQVWPWWAFGIATGVSLIIALGYFEKNRAQVVAYLDQFKRWDA
ncbi:MAG: hypothetical protein SGI77_25330 [Pirellulaceae bacterium]|nr:hypothetical protein [Pirellulaceae bacterium]